MEPDHRKRFEKLAGEALGHHNAGRLEAAESAYLAALDLSPGDAAITHNLATIAAARGDHTGALTLFDKAMQAAPHNAATHYNRALSLEALSRSSEAMDAYRETCRLDPTKYDAHRNLAFLYLATGQRGRALDHFARDL